MSKKNKKNNYSYPDPEEKDMLSKIFKKREFYYHRIPPRDKLKIMKKLNNLEIKFVLVQLSFENNK